MDNSKILLTYCECSFFFKKFIAAIKLAARRNTEIRLEVKSSMLTIKQVL